MKVKTIDQFFSAVDTMVAHEIKMTNNFNTHLFVFSEKDGDFNMHGFEPETNIEFGKTEFGGVEIKIGYDGDIDEFISHNGDFSQFKSHIGDAFENMVLEALTMCKMFDAKMVGFVYAIRYSSIVIMFKMDTDFSVGGIQINKIKIDETKPKIDLGIGVDTFKKTQIFFFEMLEMSKKEIKKKGMISPKIYALTNMENNEDSSGEVCMATMVGYTHNNYLNSDDAQTLLEMFDEQLNDDGKMPIAYSANYMCEEGDDIVLKIVNKIGKKETEFTYKIDMGKPQINDIGELIFDNKIEFVEMD
jgi:hypothetical protein